MITIVLETTREDDRKGKLMFRRNPNRVVSRVPFGKRTRSAHSRVMTSSSPTLIPSNEIAFYEKTTIETKITGESPDNDLKTLVQTNDFNLKLDFSKSFAPSDSKVVTYLVPLCPELKWDFVTSVHGTDVPSFTMKRFATTIPTIKGGIDDLTISFVPAENLDLNAANVNAFVEAVLGVTSGFTGNVTETTIKNAPLAIAMGSDRFNWFKDFGKKHPLERPETMIGMTGIPTVMLSGAGLKALVIKNGTCELKEASEVTYGDATAVDEETGIAMEAFPLHVYGAMLIQGTIPADVDKSVFAQWQVGFETQETA